MQDNVTGLPAGRQVVLVNERDEELGLADIYEAHQGNGLKHRALSVILYRKREGKTELLLQKRARVKSVFRNLWSNTCCTNMRPKDEYLPRAVSRLQEEMGIQVKASDLRVIYRFSYEAQDTNRVGWCENELDTVIIGKWDGDVFINPEEVDDYKWMEVGELKADIEKNPKIYAPWSMIILNDKRLARALEKQK